MQCMYLFIFCLAITQTLKAAHSFSLFIFKRMRRKCENSLTHAYAHTHTRTVGQGVSKNKHGDNFRSPAARAARDFQLASSVNFC